MLTGLSIRDFVLVRALDLDLGGGFSALTGETGAGKSILMSAFGFALGARAGQGLIRPGADAASVTASFDAEADHPVRALLAARGLDELHDEPLVFRRVVRRGGPARAFLNDGNQNESNNDLRPQQDWTVEAEANKKFGAWGSTKLLFIFRDVEDRVDVIPVGANGEASNATGVNGNQADNSALNAGAAYVFVRTGTTWTQQAYLKASNTEANDRFGASIALFGDTLAIGAIFEDSNGTGFGGNGADNSISNSGAVYVFTRTGTTWAQQAYIKPTNPDINDNFGQHVALSADTLAICTTQEDSNATGVNGNQADNSASASGAVYLF